MDIVTQLQDEVNSLSTLYWNYTGILQRDAPPLAVGEEAVPTDAAHESQRLVEECKRMATAVVDATKLIDTLASNLPPIKPNGEAQLARIDELQKQNEELEKELVEELELADIELKRVQALYKLVTDEALLRQDE
mmetsp:Transcript_44523/g.74289  ORF Transcript_44523/g.74289 Transcript_44523/m.74289 type:complete len:135 (+) Transcript_44523:211-615(+)